MIHELRLRCEQFPFNTALILPALILEATCRLKHRGGWNRSAEDSEQQVSQIPAALAEAGHFQILSYIHLNEMYQSNWCPSF